MLYVNGRCRGFCTPSLQDSFLSSLCPGNVHVASLSANKEWMLIPATGSQPASQVPWTSLRGALESTFPRLETSRIARISSPNQWLQEELHKSSEDPGYIPHFRMYLRSVTRVIQRQGSEFSLKRWPSSTSP